MDNVNWSVLPRLLKEKYKPLVNIEYDLLVSCSLNSNGMMPIKAQENTTNSYSIFLEEYNAILLTAHLFENLLMFEDIRHENNGYEWFQIEIPVEYFRYPAFNNRRDAYYKEITEEEINDWSSAIKSTKETMRYSKDENIVKDNLHKLEFLSIFSYFEAYLENILVECLGYTDEKSSKEAKYNSLDKLLKIVINGVNPEIEKLLVSIKKGFFKFIEFCYLVRNLHTHNLGRANAKFMQRCFDKGLIEEKFGTTESGDKVSMGVRTNFGQPEKIIELDRYITLSVLSFEFRNYVRECVFIIESCYIQA
ncbi:MAG: hypothetical protein ACXW1W_15995 [Methylococcaceae bacterium]